MIPLMKNAFIEEHHTRQALADFILKTPKFSMDTQCFEFEKRFAKYQGKKDAVLFNSGGSANLAMLQVLKNMGKLKVGDKIGFSALTWSTNTMPIIQLGFEPIAVDVDPSTINVMSYNLMKTLEKTSLKAFFATNVLGFSGDLQRIKELCSERGIIFIEDNCESLGTRVDKSMTGNFSIMSSFSFFVAHHMSTIEGGMVVTDDEDCSEMLRIVRANGWDRNLTSTQQHKWRKRHNIKSELDAKYAFYDLGFNLRPTEVTGFLGNLQMAFIEKNFKKRNENYLRLEAVAKQNPDLITVKREHLEFVSNFSYPVICKTKQLKEFYSQQFSGAGVEIRPMIAGNIQRQPFYQKYAKTMTDLPGTDFIHENGFYFGNYPELSETDLQSLEGCLRKYE